MNFFQKHEWPEITGASIRSFMPSHHHNSIDTALDCLRRDKTLWPENKPLRSLHLRSSVMRPHSQLFWVDAVYGAHTRGLVIKVPAHQSTQPPGQDNKAWTRLKKEFDTIRELRHLAHGHPGLTIVEAMAFLPEVPALVMAEARGGNIKDLMATKGRWLATAATRRNLEQACFAAGEWLKRFQANTMRSGQQVSDHEMVEYVDVRLKKLIAYGAHGTSPSWRTDILSLFHSVWRRVPAADLTVSGVHGDFCPSNVLWSGTDATVIDFSTFQSGSVYYDPSRFYHQLGLFFYKTGFRKSVITQLQTAFLQGYNDRLDPSHSLFRLFIIQHTLCHWLGRLKTANAPFPERAYNRWVCYQHRKELERLIGQATVPVLANAG